MTDVTDFIEIDALGDEARAELAAQMYLNLAEQVERLRLTQIVNGASSGDPVPGIEDANGTAPSYGDREVALRGSMRRLREASEDIWPLVEKILERARDQRRQALS